MTHPLLVIISNRNVNPQHADERLFGEEHNAGGWDQLRVATAEYAEAHASAGRWKLNLIDDDQGQTPRPSKLLFDEVQRQVAAGEISNRFVFFAHGNNQTFLKNLNKSRKLAMVHDVNVIALSWPSHPDGGSKKKRFRRAQENAVKTAPALHEALTTIKAYTASCTQYVELNLLVHSLGNLLFKAVTEGFAPSVAANLFRRAVLHQGSPPNKNHHTWVNRIDIAREVFYTINRKDKILGYAEAIDPATMGKTRKNLNGDSAIYIDFTGGERVSNKHQLFGIRDGYVHDLIQSLLVGLDPEFEEHFSFDENENAWLVSEPQSLKASLDESTSPLDEINPDYDPEFDEPEDKTIDGAYPGLLR